MLENKFLTEDDISIARTAFKAGSRRLTVGIDWDAYNLIKKKCRSDVIFDVSLMIEDKLKNYSNSFFRIILSNIHFL
jgi:hypothetical protein